MKKKITVIFIAVLVFVMYNLFINVNTYNDVYDDNTKISQMGDSYSYIGKVGTSEGQKTELKFELSGMETLWEIEAEEDSYLDTEYLSSIESGQLKVVMITPQNEVETIFEQTGTGNKSILVKAGLNRIKIVGKSAKGNIKFTLYPGENIQLKAR